MSPWWTAIITPALIATFISLVVTNRAEKLRAQRDFLTKIFESARDDVKQALDAAAGYFPLPAAERDPSLEARIWMAERELRFSLISVIDSSMAGSVQQADELTLAFDDLIGQLTSGSFQSASATSDLKHLRLIASAGAEVRAKLFALRSAELRNAVKNDPLSRVIFYMTEPKGVVIQRH